MNQRILIVEDEKALGMTLTDRLQSEGYEVEVAEDGERGFCRATEEPFDLILLDIGLPRRNGFEVCRDIRRAGLITPIIMLTARGLTADKVVGLKLGADDYVSKPFEMAELVARVEVLLRRAPARPLPGSGLQQFGDLRIDLRGTEVTRAGRPVNLTAREFQLLRYFMEHPGETLSRETLLQQVWGYSAKTYTRTVDVHVASLRQKLESDPKRPDFIITILKLGYKFAGGQRSEESTFAAAHDAVTQPSARHE
jgi:two-component system alkaline phosphatase synthesis response regulator PhoP